MSFVEVLILGCLATVGAFVFFAIRTLTENLIR